ncbi:hypothetical protein Tco_0243129 [Tanacetum coccineum]
MGVAAQAVPQPIPVPIPEPMPEPVQPQDHLSTPPRQQTSDPIAPVFEHGQISGLNFASFSRVHETDDDAFPSTNMEDDPLGGSFHASPPRSTQAPPTGHTSGCAEDLITLTAMSYVVSTLVQRVNSLETKLKDTKKLFKGVVGKLVKKVKAMEVKLKTRKRKVVVSNSDQDEGGKQDVDLDALIALAKAAVTVESNIPPGGASTHTAASSHIPTDVHTSTSVPANVPIGVAPAGVSNKGKSLMVEEDITVKERTLKVELRRRRQQEVLDSAMYYTEADWINIMAQIEANAVLSKTLLGADVTKDNFLARMIALIKRKKQALTEKLAKERMERPMTQAKVESPEIDKPSSKKQKSADAPILYVPNVPQPPVVSSPKSSGTRRKSLGKQRLTKPTSILTEFDLDADNKTFIKVVSDEDSTDETPILWSALAGWEVISTPLGEINALYRLDQTTKHFTTLKEILHLVDRQDLLKSYGMVVKYYENHLVAGAGLLLWGDLQVLIDSQEGDVSYPLSVKLIERMLEHRLEIDKDVVGNDMTTAECNTIWFSITRRLRLELIELWFQFPDSPLPRVNTPWDVIRIVCNLELIYLIVIVAEVVLKSVASSRFPEADMCRIFKYSSQASSRLDVAAKFIFQSSRYVVPTGRVVVPTGRYVVPAGKVIIIISPGRLSLVPTSRVFSHGRVKIAVRVSALYKKPTARAKEI